MAVTTEEKNLFEILKQNDKVGFLSLIDKDKFFRLTATEKLSISQSVIDSVTETSFIESLTNIISKIFGPPLVKTKEEKIKDIKACLDIVIPNRKEIELWKKTRKTISKAIHSSGFHPADTVRLGIVNNDDHLIELSQSLIYQGPILKLNKYQRKEYELQYKNQALYLNNKIANTIGQRSKQLENTQAFVVSKSGQLYIGEHMMGCSDPKTEKILFHSSFLEDEPAEMAGMITIKNGKIIMLSNNSGHYTPKALDIYRGIKNLQEKMPHVFDPKCKISLFNGNNEATFSLENFIHYMEEKTPNSIELHESIRNKRLKQYTKYRDILIQKDNPNKKEQIHELKMMFQLEDIGTELHKAIFNKNIEKTKRLIENRLVNINQTNLLGRTALYDACNSSNNLPIVSIMLDAGADINIQDIEGKTALHQACQMETSDIAIALIRRGANINDQDNDGKTALHYACEKTSVNVVNSLIDSGADSSISDTNGKTAVEYVNGKFYAGKEIVRIILKSATSHPCSSHTQTFDTKAMRKDIPIQK